MCEASVYLSHDGKEELILEDVDILRPEDGQLYLCNVYGDQKIVKARLKEISLVNHKIILEKG